MSTPPSTMALDQTDERLRQSEGLRGALESFWRSVRAGDVGALPVVVGLLVIGTIFQALNPVFLSSGNVTNLLLDSCAVGVISLGIVCVLLVGEIDLSVGSVSGFSAAVVAVLFVRHDMNWVLAVVIACLVAGAIGLLYGVLLTQFGMPSFVSSLAGLLAFLGLQLAILGDQTAHVDNFGLSTANTGHNDVTGNNSSNDAHSLQDAASHSIFGPSGDSTAFTVTDRTARGLRLPCLRVSPSRPIPRSTSMRCSILPPTLPPVRFASRLATSANL